MAVGRTVRLWVVSDEETGSTASRAHTEKLALESSAVLVLEPGTGLEGKLKTARKGVGAYTVRVHGRKAHAGVDFSAGANAIVELARQIARIAAFTDLNKGLTVNPGIVRGGTRTNVVPDEAEVQVDIRVARLRDAAAIGRKFAALRPVDRRCRIEVTGGLNRPPMERTRAVAALFRTAERIAREKLGVALEESSTGGGSDGNFTAALGVPTLDGLGGVGEGAHALHESILTGPAPLRVALLAHLVRHLGQ
jgi:glutamate carboxypeptidase